MNSLSIDALIAQGDASAKAEIQRRHAKRVASGKRITPKMATFLGVKPTPIKAKTPKADAPKAKASPKADAPKGFDPMTATWPAVMGAAARMGISIKGRKAPEVRALVAKALGTSAPKPEAPSGDHAVGSPEWVARVLGLATAKVERLQTRVTELEGEVADLRAQLQAPEPEVEVEPEVEEEPAVAPVWAQAAAAAAAFM
jgi:hypothetical protein